MNFNIFMSHLVALVKRIALIMLLFTVYRVIFTIVNLETFKPLNYSSLAKAFFFGLRFDFVVIYYLNIVFIVLHLFAFPIISSRLFQVILKVLFIFVNSVMMLFNFIDVEYIKYSGKRSGWELIEMLYSSTDTTRMVPSYALHYWYLLFLLILFIVLQVWLYPKYKLLNFKKANSAFKNIALPYLLASMLMLLGLAVARGIEVKPVRLITANKYVTPVYIPVLLNTPFVILNTINQEKEKLTNFFTDKEVKKYFSPVHKPKVKGEYKKMNVVIIILESCGKEYVKSVSKDGRSFAPFLNYLEKQGLYCSNAYANAKRSIDAIPPILGGFPSLLHTSFLGSAYSINSLQGLPAILKRCDYPSTFYHGAKNGSMGFDMFCKSVQFDKYIGRTEYNNDKDFDGAWGIWDEGILQLMAKNLENAEEPFLSVAFTLSSHEPYNIPKEYNDTLFPCEPKILRSMAYTDYAVKRFFDVASKSKWYNNTLFVLTPDHPSVILDKRYNQSPARLSIPIIYYCPSDTTLKGVFDGVTQELDVIPSILDYLNYPYSFVSYGKSIFEPGYRFSVSFNDVNYQIVDSTYSLLFDGEKTIGLNTYDEKDLSATKNLKLDNSGIQRELENHLKAFLQDYYFRLNNNFLGDTNDIEIKEY
jgi:phosphoglycerol transferase MdoB-like AlkP superfamily enzyme